MECLAPDGTPMSFAEHDEAILLGMPRGESTAKARA